MAGRVALSGRGHDADTSSGIPARGWREVLRRTLGRASEERLLTEAAGVAFYAVFALLAALAGLVSSWAFRKRRFRTLSLGRLTVSGFSRWPSARA